MQYGAVQGAGRVVPEVRPASAGGDVDEHEPGELCRDERPADDGWEPRARHGIADDAWIPHREILAQPLELAATGRDQVSGPVDVAAVRHRDHESFRGPERHHRRPIAPAALSPQVVDDGEGPQEPGDGTKAVHGDRDGLASSSIVSALRPTVSAGGISSSGSAQRRNRANAIKTPRSPDARQ